MILPIPKEIYKLFVDAGITNAFVGFAVEDYGFILPEIIVIAFKNRSPTVKIWSNRII